ncbi:MAG: DUF6443 domain-containing protein [Bacteroidales bacterium]|nr:DUF6443 domain-containing protein [Bacteroidales bacterium]
MKTRKTIRFIALLLSAMLLQVTSMMAQSLEPFSPYGLNVPGVEAWSMTRFGVVSPSLYNGAMTYSYPVFNYEDHDFSIPVSLEYSFEGYRPSQHSGSVGYGWHLNCGGVITREVRGLPDEGSPSSVFLSGYKNIQQMNYSLYDYSVISSASTDFSTAGGGELALSLDEIKRDLSMFDFFSDEPVYFDFNLTSYQRYDTASDIYHFSFLGHHGDFILMPDGNAHVFNCDLPEGEVSVNVDIEGNQIYQAVISFTVTIGDGTVFHFGGSRELIEYSYSLYCHDRPYGATLIPISFYLYRIDAPNGRHVDFSYANGKSFSLNSNVSYSPDTQVESYTHTSQKLYLASCTCTPLVAGFSVDGSAIMVLGYSAPQRDENALSCFENIGISAGSSFGLSDNVTGNTCLSSISIYNSSGQIVNSMSLGHTYASGSSHRMFLTSISNMTNGTHVFSYNLPSGMSTPYNDTQSVDHWGFWNNSGLSDLRNSLANGVPSDLYSQMRNTLKNPSFQHSSYGALITISYPTGGSSQISYESHYVSKRINRLFSGNNYTLDYCQTPYEVGGVRVHSITDCTDGHNDTRVFTYTSNDGTCSGILYRMPMYRHSLSFSYSPSGSRPLIYVSTKGYSNDCSYIPNRDGHVGYSYVITTHPDGSYDLTNFSCDDISYLDEYDYSLAYEVPKMPFSVLGSIITEYANFDGFAGIPTMDRFSMRGLLLSTSRFDAHGQPKSADIYSYSERTFGQDVLYSNNVYSFRRQPAYIAYPRLEWSSEVQSLGERNVNVTKQMTYNSLGQLYCTTTSNSSGETVKEYRKYLHQTNSSALKSLISDAVMTKVVNGQERLVALEKYSYSNPALNSRPSSITEYGVAGSIISSSNVFAVPSGSQSRTTTITYDSQYRPTNISRPGGAYTSYSWSGRNPVSKTDNASSNTTGYSWKDLVGLTSVSYPNGSSEAYSYDSGNRLEYIRNSSNNQVTRYQWYIGSGAYVNKVTYTSSGGMSSFSDKTWYDGLGYPVQENAVSASPSGKSIITPIVYDNMRRADAVSYLPYAASSGTSSFVQTNSAVSAQATFYRNTFGDNHAYAVNEYEPWAGGLLISSRKPGDAWSNGNHYSSRNRRTNISSDAVRKVTVSPSTNDRVITNGYHSAGSLIVDIFTDEEGDESIVFTDASGKKICTRQNDGRVNSDTYYVYDVRDSLVCVIQPEGAASLSYMSTISFISTPAQNSFFTWKYDAWGNVTEYHVPGGGTTTYTYDSRNRLVSEKTPKLAELGATMVITYDDCDRPTSEKYRRDSNGRVIQTHSWTYYPFGTSAPAGSRGLLQSETVWEIPQSMSDSQNSLAYCTRNYTYDSEGRVTGIAESWSDGWSSNVSTTYDFLGNVTSVTETHNGPMGYSQTISTSYTYDQRGRKLTCSRSVSGDETGDMALATVTYSYDELGRPSGKTVTGANGSTFIDEDIDLDIHGWTTGITAKRNGSVPFFFENLSYTNPSISISTARFDGNISEITSVHNTANASNALSIYSYSYDGMKRLTDARHTGQNITLTESNINTERNITYDRDGNITSLTRYDESGTPLALSFSNTGNRLTSVNGNSYSYDSAGNMTHDSRKGLDTSYNCLNLPRTAVTADGSSLTYTYLADGTKVSAISNYGYGLKYRGSFVYDYDEYDGEQIQSIGWDEGRLEMLYPPIDTTTVDFVRFAAPIEEPVDTTGVDYIAGEFKDLFFVTDHLGNVRSVVDISPVLSEPEFLEQNDYLPFGTKVQNPSYAKVDDNRYRYAGKEEQSIGGANLSLLDFGARYYDPYVARWTSVDPMAGKYLVISPYVYCGGEPLNRIDPDGKKIVVGSVFRDYIYKGSMSKSVQKHDLFVGLVHSQLEQLKGLDPRLNDMITELEKSENLYTITESFSGENKYNAISNTIYFLPLDYNSPLPGEERRDPLAALAHELGHAQNDNNNTRVPITKADIENLKGNDVLKREKSMQKINANEKNSIEKENIVREHLGLNLRDYDYLRGIKK